MSRYITLVMAPFDGKYITSLSYAIAMYAPVLTIYEIFAKHIKCKKIDLANDRQGRVVEKHDLCQLNGNV